MSSRLLFRYYWLVDQCELNIISGIAIYYCRKSLQSDWLSYWATLHIYASSHHQDKFGVCAYQSEYHVSFFVQFCFHLLFISVTELIAYSEHCLLTRSISTLLFTYIFSISLVFDLLPTLLNYSKVERVLTPLVFIAFATFCATSSISRFIVLAFTLSRIIACNLPCITRVLRTVVDLASYFRSRISVRTSRLCSRRPFLATFRLPSLFNWVLEHCTRIVISTINSVHVNVINSCRVRLYATHRSTYVIYLDFAWVFCPRDIHGVAVVRLQNGEIFPFSRRFHSQLQ